jgi:hypothetical protein
MNRVSQLICLAALLSATAFAQTTTYQKLPSDPSLADIQDPTQIDTGDFRSNSVSQPIEVEARPVQQDGAQPDAAAAQQAPQRDIYSKPARLPQQTAPASAQPVPSESQDWQQQPEYRRAAKPSAAHPYGAQPYAAQPAPAQPMAVQPVQVQPAAVQPMAPEAMASSTPQMQPHLEMRPSPDEVVIPIATVLRLKLVRELSTATVRPGENFFATLTQPVMVNGQVVIPAESSVACRIEGSRAGRRLGGKPYLHIKAISAHTPTGELLEFTASVIDTTTPKKLDVDQEGRVRGASFTTLDKVETGSLAGAGLVAGSLIAGPAGLFIGTASGAVAGLGHSMIKHRDLTLPPGTELILELDTPATISSPQMGG